MRLLSLIVLTNNVRPDSQDTITQLQDGYACSVFNTHCCSHTCHRGRSGICARVVVLHGMACICSSATSLATPYAHARAYGLLQGKYSTAFGGRGTIQNELMMMTHVLMVGVCWNVCMGCVQWLLHVCVYGCLKMALQSTYSSNHRCTLSLTLALTVSLIHNFSLGHSLTHSLARSPTQPPHAYVLLLSLKPLLSLCVHTYGSLGLPGCWQQPHCHQ